MSTPLPPKSLPPSQKCDSLEGIVDTTFEAMSDMRKARNQNFIDLEFVTPATADEFRAHQEAAIFLAHFMPIKVPNLDNYLISFIPCLTLVYANSVPVGMFILECYRKTAELHGVSRLDLDQAFPGRAKEIRESVYNIIFHRVFHTLKKRAVISKVPFDCKYGRGFMIQQGFKRMSGTDDGRYLYKLTADDWYKRKLA